jgi:hypothetical protein
VVDRHGRQDARQAGLPGVSERLVVLWADCYRILAWTAGYAFRRCATEPQGLAQFHVSQAYCPHAGEAVLLPSAEQGLASDTGIEACIGDAEAAAAGADPSKRCNNLRH